MKSNKEHYIKYIIELISKGDIIERNSVLKKFQKQYKTSVKTFDNYWKIAKERYSDEIQATKNARAEQMTFEAKESVKRDILTKFDRMEIATKIAKGISRKVRNGDTEQILTPSDGDRLRALDYLSRLEGDYQDIDKGGNVTINLNLDKFELVSDEI
jgi:ABC-type methionine transport system ATPase subunit